MLQHNRVWGTVCDDSWDIHDAQVACRQMGCGNASKAFGGSHYGQGVGPIWLKGLNCTGEETSLRECSRIPHHEYNCNHRRDAGVECTEVKLIGGEDHCSGRVEVLHNKTWGTVCDDSWNLNSAQVVCRELDCGEALAIPGGAHFGAGYGPIWLFDAGCQGNEMSFSRCDLNAREKHSCTHDEDASVICATTRLVNGPNRCSGRVEVLFLLEWGTVCDDEWDLRDAQVVCRELGCGEAVSAPGEAHFGKGNVRTWMNKVGCQGTEVALRYCKKARHKLHECRHEEDAGVVCSDLRLMDGTSPCSGRVEIFHNDTWGTICDAGWDLQDAQVVCRQLGCGNASKALGGAHYGQGSGLIWLENINCTGEEEFLKECQKGSWRKHSCTHSQDASVECSVFPVDSSLETSIHLGVAALVFLALVGIVAEAGCRRRRKTIRRRRRRRRGRREQQP
ncbi:deleted in malignant brain tumors 1 protein-like isoform X2 [Anolis sagrei]|uniref:deleted in malignant brain tumors 1 protein-like isoform X2 n=1 Tax=Anolis sagrei TaxID=38937 RepID=UPI00352133B3